jgi:predicted ester cyclase
MTASPAEIAHTWFEEVWNRGDETAIDRLFAADGLAHGIGAPADNPIVGPARFKPFFRAFRSAFPDIRVRIVRTVSEGDMVAAHCRVTGTHHGEGLKVVPTKAPIDFWGICILRVRDGQIHEAWNSFDFLSLYQQIGVLPDLVV